MFSCREPTDDEMENCTRLVLTSDATWDVTDNATPKCDLQHDLFEDDNFRGTYNVSLNPSKSVTDDADPQKYQAKLAWMPIPIVKKALKCTTQLAKIHLRLPMRHHYKSRFPQLNRNRLRETYCTDTFFSSVTSISDMHTCMQIFVGSRSSMYTKVYGMRTESEGPATLEQFITDVGAPYHLLSDNAKMETSRAWKDILRKYNVSIHTTEPYHPNQNYAERKIQEIKKVSNRILDHTNALDTLWSYATKHAVDVMNHTSNATLKWKTPIEKAFGLTPDISALVQFCFFQPIYYLDRTQPFPQSKELLSRFLGLAKSMGDALTYYVLTDTNTVIARSGVRSALDTKNVNYRGLLTNKIGEDEESVDVQDAFQNNAEPYAGEQEIFENQNIHHVWGDEDSLSHLEWNRNTTTVEPKQIVQSTKDLIGVKEKPIINPEELIESTFIAEHNNVQQRAKVVQWTPQEGKFILEFLNGGETMMTYNDLINYYSKNEEENAELYAFQRIIGHKKFKNAWLLNILWTNGEETWEPMILIKSSDPLTMARYAHDHQLFDLKGWKWCKRYHKDPSRFIRAVRVYKSKVKRLFKTYKFGVEIPKFIKQALLLDQQNGNQLWLDAINKEVNELLEHDTFKIIDNVEELASEYQFIPPHFVLDCKFDGRRKVRLVAGGNWTNPDDSDIYSRVVSIETVRLLFFIADLNGLLIIAAGVKMLTFMEKQKKRSTRRLI